MITNVQDALTPIEKTLYIVMVIITRNENKTPFLRQYRFVYCAVHEIETSSAAYPIRAGRDILFVRMGLHI